MRIEGIRIKGERIVDAGIIPPNLAIWVDANMFLYTSRLTLEQIQQNYYFLKGRFGV